MQQEQDTESPGQPHGGAICAQQGACSKEHRAQGQRLPSRECGQNPAGLGAGDPWGSPFGPTFAGRRGNRIYFGESIRKKELRGDYRFKEVVGARSTTAEGFFLEKLRVNTGPGDVV